jgi:hypothetical protein
MLRPPFWVVLDAGSRPLHLNRTPSQPAVYRMGGHY